MKSKMIKFTMLALLVSGSVYAEISSLGFNELSGLANENAASLMELTTKDCMPYDGKVCYGIVVDDDDTNLPEVEYATDWINRFEVVE